MQINRLFDIIYILLDKKAITAVELAAHFEVSVRTIYRDIDTLCQAGIPLYCERGKNGGIRLTENFVLNKSLLSDQEKFDILSGLYTLKATGAEDGSSFKRLSAFLGHETVEWVSIDFSDWSNLRKELFYNLKNAVIEHKELQFDYYNTNGTLTHRKVRPVQLWFKNHYWYLRALCLDKNSMRLFKLSRIHRLEVTGNTFAPFSVPDIPLPDRPTKLISFTMKIDKHMAFRIYDDFEEEEITVCENGDFLVKPSFPFDEWVLGLILSYGPYANVLEPIDFRNYVGTRIMDVAKIYLNNSET